LRRDIGSTTIEENVVASAGTHNTTTTEEPAQLIRAFGKTPVQRDTYYRELRAF
jgi:cyclic dehypoxanthinyl futalosine synthase